MTRIGAVGWLLAVALGGMVLGGCSSAKKRPEPAPTPTSLQEVDPCSLLDQSVLDAHGLTKASENTAATSRSCSWASGKSSAAMVLIRWDRDTLVDFSQAFPDLVDGEIALKGQRVVMGKSSNGGACGAVIVVAGTIVEIVSGDDPPAAAGAACERVRSFGEVVVQRLREQKLLDPSPTAS
jgi:hypothetical protein